MARKEMITIDKILDTAFAMTREEGFANVTARRVAAKAGCSTQPIFRVYKNMEELWDAVYERAAAYFLDYYSLYPRTGKTPFANLGMAYIAFAISPVTGDYEAGKPEAGFLYPAFANHSTDIDGINIYQAEEGAQLFAKILGVQA